MVKHQPQSQGAKSFWETLGDNQVAMRRAIFEKRVTIAVGPAGTGKTLVATFCAIELLEKTIRNNGIDKFVISRPTVVVGEDLGFLPGSLDDKISPFLRPVYELIKDSNHRMTQEFIMPRDQHEASRIEGVAISMMRGMTFTSSLVLIDEAQNLTAQQFEMMLTRIGENSKMVFTGDLSQCDLPHGPRGMQQAMDLLKDDPEVAVIEFTADDVRRCDFVGRVIKKYAEARTKVRAVA
jgi:phosphate starvation-inducible PhoH-like protein